MGSLCTLETMKYQVHFEARTKLGFRQRTAEALGLLNFRSLTDANKIPAKIEAQEHKAMDVEKTLPDFLHFRKFPALSKKVEGA